MSSGARLTTRLSALLVLLALVLALQAGTDTLAPTGTSASSGRAIGRASFAYLTGIRTFTAAALWNRLDPIGDTYYNTTTLHEQVFLLPSLRMIIALDPQFTRAYYVAAWVVWERGDRARGLRLAREGATKNPRSGLMIEQMAQLLLFTKKDPGHLAQARSWADKGTASDVVWTDVAEKFGAYTVFRAVYRQVGDKAAEAKTTAEIERLRALPSDAQP